MAVLLANNASSVLAGAIDEAQTEIAVSSGTGAKFPLPGGDDWFPVTLEYVSDSQVIIEIMRCTGRVSDVLTVERAQEGTLAQTFPAGAIVELRVTNGVFQYMDEKSEAYRLVNVVAGSGLVGGGNLDGDVTINLGMPRTLNGGTVNGADEVGHTHAIESTAGRSSTSTTTLLQAKAMRDHAASGDHDSRYPLASTVSSASTGSTIVERDGSGDIHARLFRSEYDTTNSSIGFVMTQVDTGTNNFIRPSTPGQLMATLGPLRSITAGNGLTGGGTLAASRSIALGTPGTVNGATSNGVSGSSHTHAVTSTASRSSASTSYLLQAKAMNDHRVSGDHDARYIRLNNSGQVAAATSGVGTGTVGSYGLFILQNVGTGSTGKLVAGSNMRYSSASGGDYGGAPGGTWRIMGWADNASFGGNDSITVCLRVS